MKNVPENELFSAYLDGELTADEQAQMDRLLASSPEARQLLDEFRAISSTLQSLPQSKLGEDLGPRILRMAERRMLAGETPPAEPPPGPDEPPWYRRLLRPRNLLWPALAASVAVAILFLGRSGQERPVALRGPAAVEDQERPTSAPPSIGAAPGALTRTAEEAVGSKSSDDRPVEDKYHFRRGDAKRGLAVAKAKPAPEPAGAPKADAAATAPAAGMSAAESRASTPPAPAQPPAAAPAPPAAPAMLAEKAAKQPPRPEEMGGIMDASDTSEKALKSEKKSDEKLRADDAPKESAPVVAGKGPSPNDWAMKQKGSGMRKAALADRGKEGIGPDARDLVVVRLNATAETPSIQLLRDVLHREQSVQVQVLEADAVRSYGMPGGGPGKQPTIAGRLGFDAKGAGGSSAGQSTYAMEVQFTEEQLQRALGSLRSRADLVSVVAVEQPGQQARQQSGREPPGLPKPVRRARPSAAEEVRSPSRVPSGAVGGGALEMKSQVQSPGSMFGSPAQMPGMAGPTFQSQSVGRATVQAETSAGVSAQRFGGMAMDKADQSSQAGDSATQRVLFVLHLPRASALAAPKATNMAIEKFDASRSEPVKPSAAAPPRP